MTQFTVRIPEQEAPMFERWLKEHHYPYSSKEEAGRFAEKYQAPPADDRPTLPEEDVDWDEIRERWARHKIGGC